MSRQYGRAYSLTIIPDDRATRIISELRVKFEITKSILGFPNIARIEIYNPNNETISALQKEFTSIVLNAGYKGNTRLLFKGEVRTVLQSKKSTDRIITVHAGDGEQDWQNSVFNKTFIENVKTSNVIKDVLSTFKNLTIGAIEGLPENADKLRGQSLSGASRDILDGFAEEYGFDWNIQDSEIFITPKDQVLTGREAVLVNAATGMIGSPVITEIGANVTTLLNPRLLPNSAFQIESVNADVAIGNLFIRNIPRTSAEGTYKIQEVAFKGDSREGDWLSTVKGISLNV